MTMHCGYLLFLFLVLWAELAAGRVLPTDTTDQEQMQSIIDDLHLALKNYSSILSEKSNLDDRHILPCTETAADLEQSSTVVHRLSEYQVCAEQPGSFCPDISALCDVIMLNRDLLLHLNGSYQDSAWCPPSSPSSPSSSLTDFNAIRKSIQCVHCWRQQVEALRR